MNGKIFLTCAAGLLLSTTAAAQTQRPPFTAVFDDFEDGVIDSAWTVGITLGALINVEETQGVLRADGSLLTQSQNGSFQLSRTFSPMSGAFQLDVPLRWAPDAQDPLGGTSSVTMELLDVHEQPIASWAVDDSNALGAGEIQVVGPTIAHLIPLQDLQGEGFLRLHRTANGTLRFTYLGDGGPRTGMLGFVPQEVGGMRITFRHSGFGSPPFTTLELESVLLSNDLSPLLHVSPLVAGQSGTLTLYDGTPLLLMGFAYSTTGAGPIVTPFGIAELSLPISMLPTVAADATGQATLDMTVPASASGRDVWIQGLDFATGVLTPGVKTTIQ
ncbi:MAG: hypothetical protein ACPG31_06120 [Planctomycetota bacterium]